jgi:hypothetical protein
MRSASAGSAPNGRGRAPREQRLGARALRRVAHSVVRLQDLRDDAEGWALQHLLQAVDRHFFRAASLSGTARAALASVAERE